MRRNPLKSGQCFLQRKIFESNRLLNSSPVAIPSNRVNVSYLASKMQRQNNIQVAIPSNRVNVSYQKTFSKTIIEKEKLQGRNPLKSGQCFLQHPSFLTDYRKLNTPFAGTSLFLCFPFPYLTYLLP